MFQLLYPLGLLAALGILVPIIVHLWNIKNGKTLKIGSIALLGAPSNQRSRNLKVTDWPLLVLRILLVLLVAFLLAIPVYQSKTAAAERPGWILVERTELSDVWKQHHKQFDSLLSRGFEVHAFDLNFPKIDVKDSSTVFSKPAEQPLSYFSLLKQLDQTLGAGFKVFLFTGNQLSRFSGKQPETRLNLKWQIAAADSSLKTSWMASGLTAHSSTAGTYYSSAALTADTSTSHISIYQSSKFGGAGYLRAAVLAISEFTKRKVRLHDISSIGQITRADEFVFWLSDEPLTKKQLQGLPEGTTIFSYAGTKLSKINSLLLDDKGNVVDEVRMYQRTITAAESGIPVWTDGFGDVLLSKQTSAGLTWYQFYSRFNPQWTSMVWTNGMLMAMLPILHPQPGAAYGFDEDAKSLRAVDAKAFMARVNSNAKGSPTAQVYEQKLFENYIWWLLFVVFITERWLSHKKTTYAL